MPPNNTAPPRGIVSSMSKKAFRADKRPDGSLVWTEDPDKMWLLVEVLSQDNTLLRVRNKATGETQEIDLVRTRNRRGISSFLWSIAPPARYMSMRCIYVGR